MTIVKSSGNFGSMCCVVVCQKNKEPKHPMDILIYFGLGKSSIFASPQVFRHTLCASHQRAGGLSVV